MASASFQWYKDEQTKIYPQEFGIKLTEDQVRKIIRKLCNHYGLQQLKVVFRNRNSGGGTTYSWHKTISLSHDNSIGIVIHEFAHYLHDCCRKYLYNKQEVPKLNIILTKIPNKGTSHHGLHFEIVLNHVHQFAQKKNYWQKVEKTNAEKIEKDVDKSEPICDTTPETIKEEKNENVSS